MSQLNSSIWLQNSVDYDQIDKRIYGVIVSNLKIRRLASEVTYSFIVATSRNNIYDVNYSCSLDDEFSLVERHEIKSSLVYIEKVNMLPQKTSMPSSWERSRTYTFLNAGPE